MNGSLALLSIVLVGVGLVSLLVGLRRTKREVVIEERLNQFGNRLMTLEEAELSQPFNQRVLLPLARYVATRLGRFMPQQNVERLRQQLIEAGQPRGLGTTEFMGLRMVMGFGLGGLLFLIGLTGNRSMMNLALLPGAVCAVGYILPNVWLSRRIKDRRKEILRAMPDAIDLLTISVEAGLGFDPALGLVVEKWDNSLTREFGRMLSEIRMGAARREALRDMANRVNVDDLSTFVSAVIQADQLGVSISQVLRIQSKQMRMLRRQRAEAQAQKAPLKMLFPMIFLIFPSIYIVILGPAIPQILKAF
ncbi:MAG TPA: type II secretion system F family protein [Steroidobacteraceae bacterium]|nr:type II secretion system F family protein [Steroidobacteraceae bacterium]